MSQAALARKAELEEALTRIVENLVERYQPQCIILFGSLARGECSEGSDLDLCVIKSTDVPFLKRITEARLLAGTPVGMDLVVYTPEEWEQMLRKKNYFIVDEILSRGKILHGRPD